MRPQPPNYKAIKQASDTRLAAEATQRLVAEQKRQAAVAHAQAVIAAQVVPVKPTPPPVSSPISNNVAKMNVYMAESGNNPGAINASSGACGLGQALPCSKLTCTLADYACQDSWFTSYMRERYGTWENAWAFWQSHRWW